MDLAFRLLSQRARSESEVAAALEQAGASRRLVSGALGRLRALGYVDDRKLAAEWVERGKERGFGSLRIQEQLRRLDVDERIVESATLGDAKSARWRAACSPSASARATWRTAASRLARHAFSPVAASPLR